MLLFAVFLFLFLAQNDFVLKSGWCFFLQRVICGEMFKDQQKSGQESSLDY